MKNGMGEGWFVVQYGGKEYSYYTRPSARKDAKTISGENPTTNVYVTYNRVPCLGTLLITYLNGEVVRGNTNPQNS